LFDKCGEPAVWNGSADLMHRNLGRRVEVLVRLPGADEVAEIGQLLDRAFDPDTDAWELDADGVWHRNGGTTHLQEALIERQRRRRLAG
jgi:polyphosphate kinase